MGYSMIIKGFISVLLLSTIIFFWVFYKSKRKEIAVLIISSIVGLIISELTLRIFLPQIASYGNMIVYDSTLGWRFISNGKGKMIHPGAPANTIETNSLGFRDHEPLDDKKNKLMVLGDSFVSNIAVKEEEVFTEVMESQLKNADVLNFGVNGYGTVQEYLLLNKLIDEIHPDVVIVVIYLQNDFSDNVGDHWVYPKPYASFRDDDSTFTIHPQSIQQHNKNASLKNLLPKLHINRLVTRAINNLFPQTDSLSIPPEFYSCQSPVSDNYRVRFRIMEELLLRFKILAKKKKVPVVFVLAPSILQVRDDLWESFMRKNSSKQKHYIRSFPNDRLMKFAAKNNLLMLDLLPCLLQASRKNIKIYHPFEQHWTKEGNLIVATFLMDYLKSESLLNN